MFTRQETNVFERLKLNSFHVAESAITFSTGPDSKYFQLCEPHEVLVICFSFVCVCVLPHFKNVENILSSRDIQKEVLAHRP